MLGHVGLGGNKLNQIGTDWSRLEQLGTGSSRWGHGGCDDMPIQAGTSRDMLERVGTIETGWRWLEQSRKDKKGFEQIGPSWSRLRQFGIG